MKKEILINVGANETRIAITEDGHLAELFVETENKEKLVGDIYLGRVVKVMPGIRAAFVDLGLPQDGFLHFSDIGNRFEEYSSLIGDDADADEDDGDGDAEGDTGTANGNGGGSRPPRQEHSRGRSNGRHDVLVEKGQDIIVQVVKEPVGKKGVRVTSEVSLAGRFLVLLPFDDKVGISKKISSFKEKRRLRRAVSSILPSGFGAIIRTVAESQEEEAIKNDLEELIATWRKIEQSVKSGTAPALLHKDLATTSSVIRDLFSNDVTRVVVDSRKLHKEISSYIRDTSASFLDKVELHAERRPIFDAYGIEKEIEASLSRKVWLKSGGYIIIEPTEAMVVIDVNSGRYAAKKDQELNSLRTDIEAAREVTRQLRLRDMGGIIVVDFIDLEDERNRRKVFEEMKKEFRRDRAKVTVLPMTEFGLVQITRQRIRQTIIHSFTESCPACRGTGLVQSRTTTINQLERWLRRFKAETGGKRIVLRVHPEVGAQLTEGFASRIRKLMLRHLLHIRLEEDTRIPFGEFRVLQPPDLKDVTDQFN